MDSFDCYWSQELVDLNKEIVILLKERADLRNEIENDGQEFSMWFTNEPKVVKGIEVSNSPKRSESASLDNENAMHKNDTNVLSEQCPIEEAIKEHVSLAIVSSVADEVELNHCSYVVECVAVSESAQLSCEDIDQALCGETKTISSSEVLHIKLVKLAPTWCDRYTNETKMVQVNQTLKSVFVQFVYAVVAAVCDAVTMYAVYIAEAVACAEAHEPVAVVAVVRAAAVTTVDDVSVAVIVEKSIESGIHGNRLFDPGGRKHFS